MNFYRANPYNYDASALYRVSDGGILYNTTGERKYANNTELNSEVIVGGGLSSLEMMFYNCTNLNSNVIIKESNIPRNLWGTFMGCAKLNSKITFERMNASSCIGIFQNCYLFNQDVDFRNVNCSDFAYAFYICRNLNKSVKFPYEARKFTNCFNYCLSLHKPKIIVNVLERGDYMFWDTGTNLKDVYFNAQFVNEGANYRNMFPYVYRQQPLNLHFSNRIGLTDSQKENVIAYMIGGDYRAWVKNNENHWFMPNNNVHVFFNETIEY
jgi:hypothetical protein